ncbi:MAG: HutP family protein [Clostridia bacterium]|nr:HutP family protein [Clostridia bacterium]MDH7572325.1 HutP family protein [Clostridia bacterium]
MPATSRKVAGAAVRMAITESREEEVRVKKDLASQSIRAAAVDYGGEFATSVSRIVERAVVAAKREGVIRESHVDEGAVAGATREALSQLMVKAMGLNVGGKIGIARQGEHVAVAVFFGVGLLHLDEVAIGLGHRALPGD